MATSTSQNSDRSQKRVYPSPEATASRRSDGGVFTGVENERIAQEAEDAKLAYDRKIKAGMKSEMFRLAPITPENRKKK